MKKISIILGIFLVLNLSCSDWLSLDSHDKIMEEELFSDPNGYYIALNGVYKELANANLYGDALSCGFVDVLAQCYDVRNWGTHSFLDASYYRYTSIMSQISSIWNKFYSVLLNCNTIIEWCNREDCILSKEDKDVVLGEALALRGMLHLDLQRLWGPVYSEESKPNKSLPFQNSSNCEMQELISAEEFMNLVIDDLKAAIMCLEDSDPVFKEGGQGDNLRQYRLNYFAVKLLLSRAYLWMGDKENAKLLADEVIEGCHKSTIQLFPFAEKEKVLSTDAPDFVFSTEVLFGLYYSLRKEAVYEKYFAPSLKYNCLRLYGNFYSGRIKEMYDDENDLRYKAWAIENVDGVETLYHKKFGNSTTASICNMLPLIRISEAYLIAAECSEKSEDVYRYLNAIREARWCRNFDDVAEMTSDCIQKEMRRELLGEGQIFFTYKRQGLSSFPDGASASSNYVIDKEAYVLPIPTSEQQYRSNN